jgi:hypothetical protein
VFEELKAKFAMHIDDSDSIPAELIADTSLWWGWSESHGWVVLDQQDSRNASPDFRYLVRCDNWTEFAVSRLEFSLQITGLKYAVQTFPDEQARLKELRALQKLHDDFPLLRELLQSERANQEQRKQLEEQRRREAERVAEEQAERERQERARREKEQEAERALRRKEIIQQFCRDRGIKSLIHFTRLANLSGILAEGLLPRSELELRARPPVFNDELRWDRRKDAVCLSIGFPNYAMFMKYRDRHSTVIWVILEVTPDVLWEQDCAFCKHNAACREMRAVQRALLREPQALLGMYADEITFRGEVIRRANLPACFPTDPQAEILTFGRIDPSRVLAIHFSRKPDADCWQQASCENKWPVWITPSWFRYRQDWEQWKKEPTLMEGIEWHDDPFFDPF